MLEADLFYIPAFFSVLFWRGDVESLRCVALTFQVLSGSEHFHRHEGRDHLVLYGVERGSYNEFLSSLLTYFNLTFIYIYLFIVFLTYYFPFYSFFQDSLSFTCSLQV